MKLSGTELVISHRGYDSPVSAPQRNCRIALSWSSPVAFFGSRVDIPFFQPLGDYVIHLSKDAVQTPTIGLTVSAHF